MSTDRRCSLCNAPTTVVNGTTTYDPSRGVRVGDPPPPADERLRSLAKLGASYQHLERLGIMLDPPHGYGTLWECEAKRCVEARALAWTPEERAMKEAAK